MKLIVMGYHDEAHYYEIESNQAQLLDRTPILNASFIVKGNNVYYTYEQSDPLKLKSYRINHNRFEVLDTLLLPLKRLTHLAYAPKYQLLFGASYHDGAYCVIKTNEGRFKGPAMIYYDHPERGLSRCHCVAVNHQETELALVNIAQDTITRFHLPTMEVLSTIHLPQGCGPRHLIYNQSGTYCYLNTEYSNEIFAVRLADDKIIPPVSTLQHQGSKSYGATLFFDEKETYLYGSNRGEETIVRFQLEDHTLTNPFYFSTYGQHSRHMILSKDGKILITANKNTNEVTLIDLDTHQRIITIPFTQPSCMIETD